jgi:DNA polymerase-4
MCDQVAARLAKAHLAGYVVTLKIRFSDFVTITRSSTRDEAVRHTAEIWETAGGLIGRAGIAGRAVRLLGVSVGDLVDSAEARQLVLGRERNAAAAEAVDHVRERFGPGAVFPARIAPRPGQPEKRPSEDR